VANEESRPQYQCGCKARSSDTSCSALKRVKGHARETENRDERNSKGDGETARLLLGKRLGLGLGGALLTLLEFKVWGSPNFWCWG
jgi:hypothetical protein